MNADDERPFALHTDFVGEGARQAFFKVLDELRWEQRDDAPRSEYFCAKPPYVQYSYGRGLGRRTYDARPLTEEIRCLWIAAEVNLGVNFEMCFLNRYQGAHEHLGWHNDLTDDERPVAVVSLGAERRIWMRSIDDHRDMWKIMLPNGSLFVMHPHVQKAWMHRIPKSDRDCGTRISLTFRGVRSDG